MPNQTTFSDGTTQHFITLVNKSGAYFYLVIDLAADSDQTAHFLNTVDEADLLALMDKEDIPEPEPEKEDDGAGKFVLVLMVLAGMGGGGAYVAYRRAGYSKKFREEHREEITLHQAAKDAFNELNLKKLPKVKDLNVEYGELLNKKKKLYPECRRARDEMRELLTVKSNVD